MTFAYLIISDEKRARQDDTDMDVDANNGKSLFTQYILHVFCSDFYICYRYIQ